MTTPTIEQLKQGLSISERIAALEAELKAIFGGSTSPNTTSKVKATSGKVDGRRGKKSPETIAKMRAAQRARFAMLRTAKGKTPSNQPDPAKVATPAKKKRKPMSPEAKAKIADAMKARWAAAKAGKGPVPTAKKK